MSKKNGAAPAPAAIPATLVVRDVAPAREIWMRVGDIIPRPELNTRTHFDTAEIYDLAQSIAENGLLQALMLHETHETVKHLCAGERRWRACKLLGDDYMVRCTIKEYSESEMIEIMIIENFQRTDLTAIEKARGFQKALSTGISQADLATKLGTSQPVISNAIRLLDLPDAILQLVDQGTLQPSHARDYLLPFSKIPEKKRTKLYAEFAKAVAGERYDEEQSEVHYLRDSLSEIAEELSRPIRPSPRRWGIDESKEPKFAAEEHAGCSCNAPAFKYGTYDDDAVVRCFDEKWWDAAQKRAIAAAEARESKKDSKAAPKVKPEMTDDAFAKAVGASSWQLDISSQPADASVLADAPLVVVKRSFGDPTVCCADPELLKRARSAATRFENASRRAMDEERALADRTEAEKTGVEPWMLAQMMAGRTYDDAIMSAAADLGIDVGKERFQVSKRLLKLPTSDIELLFKVLAIRSKRPYTDRSAAARAKAQKKFGPGIAALKRRALAAITNAPAAAVTDPSCIDCGCTESNACDGGCSWIVLNKKAGRGICSACAPTLSAADAGKQLKEHLAKKVGEELAGV